MISHRAITLFFQHIKNNFTEHVYQYNDSSDAKVDYVENIPYEEFFTNYLSQNKPCIISVKDISSWKSTVEWVTKRRPNFEYLEQNFGSSVVPVADCNAREYNSQKKKSLVFKDYLNYWCNSKSQNSELLYLKDWHFKREFPDYEAYFTPEYFRSDWLNEFCVNQDDDYQFVYMGPKGTWTPFHADVFGSYSWSVNICGRKKWLLFPPGYEHFLKDEKQQLPYMVDEKFLKEQNIFHLEIIQDAQEIIFVPSGWHHQVWNLEDTISINHNWFNGCNIQYIWNCLYEAALDVENEIADIKEFEGWEDQLQVILKAHHGMNYSEFFKLLQFITKSRIEKIESTDCRSLDWHYVFDLLLIKHLCSKMNSQLPKIFQESIQELNLNITKFLVNINEVKNIFLSTE